MVHHVVLLDVDTDVFFQLLILVLSELQSALQNSHQISAISCETLYIRNIAICHGIILALCDILYKRLRNTLTYLLTYLRTCRLQYHWSSCDDQISYCQIVTR